MKKKPFRASYECGLRLAELGCSLPNLSLLPRNPKTLVLREPDGLGYTGARAIDFGFKQTIYVFALQLATERLRGVTICDCQIEAPWPDHHAYWAYDKLGFRQSSNLNCDGDFLGPDYDDMTETALNGLHIKFGHPVQGYLCGMSRQMPDSAEHGASFGATIKVVDHRAETFSLNVSVSVDRKRFACNETAIPEQQREPAASNASDEVLIHRKVS